MLRPDLRGLAFAAVMLLVVGIRGTVSAAGEARPNVVFLLTDDQRADTIAALGNPGIITPNLDALARRGLVFRNAYCMGGNSAAVCAPSRNMMLSGRTYFRFGRFAEANRPNVPRSFREAGYETWHLGKHGNTADDIHKVFEHSTYLDDEKARTCGKPGRETVDAALEFLGNRDPERPFFMWFEFAVPHDPRIASPGLMAMYDETKIALPKNFLPKHPFDNGELKVRDEMLADFPRTEAEIRRHLHDYYAVITGLDREIGRLVAALRERGELERTIIVFTSDHGLAIGSHGLMGKQNLYEDGLKPPLIISGPGIAPGTTNALVYLHDLYPTLCELTGIAVPDGLDGISLVPVIQGKQTKVRDTIFLSYRHLQRAIRDERYKLIYYPEIDRTQLFNLLEDPWEMNDLAGPAENQDQIADMFERLAIEAQAAGDTLPLERPPIRPQSR